MGAVGSLMEFWLGVMRWTILIILSPLILPFMFLSWLTRVLGKSVIATLLALAAAPFMFGWWAVKTGGRFLVDFITSVGSLAATAFKLPYRALKAVFA